MNNESKMQRFDWKWNEVMFIQEQINKIMTNKCNRLTYAIFNNSRGKINKDYCGRNEADSCLGLYHKYMMEAYG